MHHNPGLFNGIWSDMAIEMPFMRYGHGQSGIIGITLRPETVKTWAYSLHACNTVVSHLDVMRTQDQHKPPSQTHHIEETKARIQADAKDNKELREKLEVGIDPLQTKNKGHCQYSDRTSMDPSSLNVDNAPELGTQQMEEFERCAKQLP